MHCNLLQLITIFLLGAAFGITGVSFCLLGAQRRKRRGEAAGGK